MNQQRLQDLLAKVKTANDEKEGLVARARAYAQQNPTVVGTAGAGGAAALLTALFSRRGNRLRNALLGGAAAALGGVAGQSFGLWYPGAMNRYFDRQAAARRLMANLRAQSAVTDSNTNHGGDRQRAEQGSKALAAPPRPHGTVTGLEGILSAEAAKQDARTSGSAAIRNALGNQ